MQWEHRSGSWRGAPQPCSQMPGVASILERREPRPREGRTCLRSHSVKAGELDLELQAAGSFYCPSLLPAETPAQATLG